MFKKLYNHGAADCFYLIKGKGFQVLFDDETMEELRIEGVTHGEIELYLIGQDVLHVNVSVDFLEEIDLSGKLEKNVESVDFSAYETTNGDHDDQMIEQTSVSEPEEIIDDKDAGSSDEEFIAAKNRKKEWTIKGSPLHKLFWSAVKAYTKEEFENSMNKLRQQSAKAYTEMCERNVQRFCRSFHTKNACTGVTCNNMAETFNSWIIEAREKPILTMLKDIRRQVMSRMVEKKTQAMKCNGIVTPRIRATLNDNKQATRNWRAIEANTNVYEVQHIHNSKLTYAVRLEQMEMLSKLNPMAKEFVPPSLVNCVNNNNVMYNSNFGYVNNFLTPPPNAAAGNVNGFPGRRRRNGFGQGKRRMNSRTSIAQREDVIRRTVY
ncbi:hypothetical protein SOVF_103560 [Spinacia oleracea]|nr:hypothetical protein SOVF_103560 [Spinacia oleracea]